MHSPTHLFRSVTIPAAPDPFLRWQGSALNKLARVAWQVTCALLFRPSPRPMHAAA